MFPKQKNYTSCIPDKTNTSKIFQRIFDFWWKILPFLWCSLIHHQMNADPKRLDTVLLNPQER